MADNFHVVMFRFTVMLGVGSDLVEPQLATGQHLNGELLSKIFCQKTIWLVPKEKLSFDDQKEEVKISHL